MNHRHYLGRSSTQFTRRPRSTREAIVSTFLFAVGGTRHQRRFVAYSLHTGELLRGVR